MRPPHAVNSAVRTITALAAIVTLATACGGSSNGTSLRDVPFTASDGEPTTLADFAGSPVVVNMWATWCQPCVREMPAFDEVASHLSAVQIIGVNIFDTPTEARAFAADLGVHYPQYTDPDGVLSTALSVSGYPATAFFSADGTLLELHQGELTADELRALMARLYPEIDTKGTGS